LKENNSPSKPEKKGDFLYAFYLLCIQLLCHGLLCPPSNFSKQVNLCKRQNKVFCKGHKIWFTGFKAIRPWFDDKLDNAPTSLVQGKPIDPLLFLIALAMILLR